ncbi:hypothetical protein PFICI_06306 [Pestalotiopsis fici W106-1]|uniref:DUF7730 domain-containing protein n=1 Tax=Pestalotiopsis fici (strain W106-1 / CGMCC3.15140) TaxID=1229662 RepID=W3X5M2_PESFW|nr:uncharacterized protein PFICI_06306 [Pestalotiopsis fici W106-1]ETS81304.1 hypothetical protein PFICI_06306 [Pestalotiopsis fici W106-1]
MAPLQDVEDPSHPNVATTRQNAEAPFFRLLPIEIRLKIYEYALSEVEPIHVQQIAARSNKFAHQPGSIATRREMFVSRLTRVSRQIYLDLNFNPVFYRVNKFEFDEPCVLLQFLAALTPTRRALIRDIKLSNFYCRGFDAGIIEFFPNVDLGDHGIRYLFHLKIHVKVFQHLSTLLSFCHDLRHLRIRVSMRKYWDGLPSVGTFLLTTFINAAASDELDPSMRRISHIDPILVYHHGPFEKLQTEVDLTDTSPLPTEILTADQTELLTRARVAVASLKQRWKRAERDGHSTRINPTEKQLREALQHSRIDFPGEDRMELDRFNNTSGTVSSRTRQKCKKEAVDISGVIQRTKNKYNAEGMLTWRAFDILGLRRSESTIEVEVQNTSRFQPWECSWEPIESVISADNEDLFRWYYDRLLTPSKLYISRSLLTASSARKALQRIQEHPSPKELIAMVPGLFIDSVSDESPLHIQKRKRRRANWDFMQQQHQNTIHGLTELVEKKASEEKMKEDKDKKEKKQKSKKRKRTSSS